MKKIVVNILTGLLLSGAILSAAGQSEKADTERLSIVTSTSIINDVVQQVSGDAADVKGLIIPGQDPHSYEPTPRDMAAVEKADILFLNGFDLEEGLVRILENVSTGQIIEISEHIDLEHQDSHEMEEEDEHAGEGDDEEHNGHDHGGVDPHTWMSPFNVIQWTQVIVEVLSEADPSHASVYQRNGALYAEKLRSLHNEIEDSLETLPRGKKVLITDHDALGYYADLYGFEVAGTIMPNLSTSSETSARHLSDLVHLLKERHIRTIFIGSTAGADIRKLTNALEKEIGDDIYVETLLTGSLTEAGGSADNYIDFLRYNTRRIVDGLSR